MFSISAASDVYGSTKGTDCGDAPFVNSCFGFLCLSRIQTATTTADIVSTSRANVAIVEPPLIEPVVSVAPPTSAHTHVYESAKVSDEPVWVLRATAPSVTASSSTPYVAHSTVLPRTACQLFSLRVLHLLHTLHLIWEANTCIHRTLRLLLLTFVRH